ncbi:hypothetical protein V1286_005585 [Bradyrhizobium algeriense]|uniref:Uncharacterized protein n=1 Tax=Bradyrhizobium algeriense TaxID=634784 RepID=A0ABU8BHM6_9BRAD
MIGGLRVELVADQDADAGTGIPQDVLKLGFIKNYGGVG